MADWVTFDQFVTKGIEIEKGDRRIFTGHITAEIIDRQNEFIFVAEVMKIMKTFMSVNPVISDFHSNRMVGRVLKYEQSEYQGVATVLITGEVYKKDGVTLYDKVWEKVVKGEYAGLSMGGASKEREPIRKDGRTALELRKLELYEIALCATPANPFAIIESVNIFAKSAGLDDDMIKESGGRQYIACTSLQCKFEKGTNMDNDNDIDNKPVHEYICVNSGVCDVCGLAKSEHKLEQFDKDPVEKFTTGNSIGRRDSEAKKLGKGDAVVLEPDPLVGTSAQTRDGGISDGKKQFAETQKGVGDAKSLVGRSAETRSESIGEATGSPKEVNDTINAISAGKVKKDYAHDMNEYKKEPEDQKKQMDGRIKDRSIEKDHIPSTPEKVEEDAKKIIEGEKAGQRTIHKETGNSGHHDESLNPAEHQQTIEEKMHSRSIKVNNTGIIEKIQIEGGKLGEVTDKEVEKEETIPEDTPKHWQEKGVNSYIKYFGVEAVRTALEEHDTIAFLKKLARKYN